MWLTYIYKIKKDRALETRPLLACMKFIIHTNNDFCLKQKTIILVSMMQGGIFDKLQFDKAPSICSTVPMEAVVFEADSQLFIQKG